MPSHRMRTLERRKKMKLPTIIFRRDAIETCNVLHNIYKVNSEELLRRWMSEVNTRGHQLIMEEILQVG